MSERDAIDDVVFRSDALSVGDLFVTRVHGVEALSDPFEFVIFGESRADVGLEMSQIESLLALPAYLAFGPDEEYRLHGVIRKVDMLPSATLGRVQYQLVMVPRLWHLSLTAGTWIYQDLNTPDIIKDVLMAAGLTEGDDFEFRLTAKYPSREYTMQYQESDLAFVSRTMEHDGIFFFFTHEDGRDKLVMTDRNVAFSPCAGHESIAFDPRGGVTDFTEVITSVGRSRQLGTRAVTVKDYNWRTPSTRVAAGYVFDQHGLGTTVEYGAHVKDAAAAKRLAKIRAEEFFCQRERFQFTSHVRGLRTGHRFSLIDHFVEDFGVDYVVTFVEHSVVQAGTAESGERSERYTNRFEAIRADVQFRPVRKTPRPRIPGFLHAKTDGSGGAVGSDGGTPIDGEGRYKVALPMDQHRTANNRSSRWIRRAQPASGDGYGMHLPLHIGTEVMLIHMDGDPDRPVIVGTVPNPENASPVTSADPTTSRIKSRSGVVMGWNDKR